MNDMVLICKTMETLRLRGMSKTCCERLDATQKERWSYSNLLDTLLTDEIEKRNHIQLSRRLAKSMLNQDKTLESGAFAVLGGGSF